MTTRALSLAGKRFSNHGRSAGTLLLFALVSLCAISCTTIPREVAERGLFDTFEMTPQVLLRTDGLFLRDLVDSLDDDTIRRFINAMNSDAPQVGAKKPIDRSRIDSMLSRTHVAAIGIAWNDKTSILFEAALAGNFARIPTAISFALDSSWKRITGGFVAKSAPLYVRDPEGGKLHI
ncbi:MAG: hypothetical protein N3A02_04900, partial [Rectinema sp.]|nr:hypothetical protein [Rectinema sp.]